MDLKRFEKYNSLILRVFLGLTVLFWGYEKLTLEKLVKSYTMDYEQFMFFEVNAFLGIVGYLQIIIGTLLIVGLLTRFNAVLLTLMGLVTITIPGMVVMKDVPHFAYAFALTGAALVLVIEGGGDYSLDTYWRKIKCSRFNICELPA